MAKKTLKKKTMKTKAASKSAVGQVADPLLDSARDVWLAGLGAFAVAQSESSKMMEQGAKWFDNLVTEGAKVEASSRKMAKSGADDMQGKLDRVRSNVENSVESARKQAQDNWDKLESVFEDRVARVLARLGVPTADDVQKLARRVEALGAQMAKLDRKAAAPAAGDDALAVFHLLPKDEDWTVRREGEDAELSVHDTKKQALDAARGIAQASEPSRLVVHRADGTIQATYSYGTEA